MNKTKILWIGLAIAALAGAAALAAWPRAQLPDPARLEGLPATTGSFQQADGSYRLAFPLDFGPHDDYQTEWWYYTGNLQDTAGKHYGFQLTFFRRAIHAAPERTPRASAWAAEQVYMAHFTLTDVPGQRFHYFERFSRGSAGLAGASADPAYHVWLENWSVEATGSNNYHLQAQDGGLSLDLNLNDSLGPVLQGKDGLSVKGPGPGNASYYFSQPALAATGSLRIDGSTVQVSGTSWMDHEFSTSALGPELVGWDWFSLQLDDGSELMVYNLRRADGSVDPYSSGTLIRADGSTRYLRREDFKITQLSTWRSPHSGAVYPSGWTVAIPSEGIALQVQPYLADQELRVSFTYWEGAVRISGSRQRRPVSGNGYVELTGYARSMQGQL